MKIAFTGTRSGMTRFQLEKVMEVIRIIRACKLEDEQLYLFHGGCHGADREAHKLVMKNRIIFPSNTEQAMWAFTHRADGDIVHPIEKPLVRNRRMVDLADVVIAAPASPAEILRSGTWATIRYARKIKRKLIICYPNGNRSVENVDEAIHQNPSLEASIAAVRASLPEEG